MKFSLLQDVVVVTMTITIIALHLHTAFVNQVLSKETNGIKIINSTLE